jgi:predicted DNA-binding transcriptional regulator YafY
MNLLICEAIRNKQQIRFEYEHSLRIIKPFRYGRSVKGDKDFLRAYQLKNSIKLVDSVGWRLFDLTKIHRLEILAEYIERNRPNYSYDDEAMLKPYYAEINWRS